MGDTSEPVAKGSSKETKSKPAAEPPLQAPEQLVPVGPEAFFFDLQRSLGNRFVSRLIEGGAGPALRTGRVPARGRLPGKPRTPIQREPQATMPPPNQSVAPAPPKLHNNGINYQGNVIFPDTARCKALLKSLLPEKGFQGASSYGHSFAKATAEVKAGWSLFADADYIQQCQGAMQTAANEFDEECRIFVETFETMAGNITDQLLINAKEQIEKEQQKLGMQEKVIPAGRAGSTKSYSVTNQSYLAEAKAAAGVLAKRRSEVDALGRKNAAARKKLEDAAAKAAQPSKAGEFPVVDLRKPPEPLTVTTSQVGGLPAFVPQSLVDEQEMTYKAWQEGEEDFKKQAHEATGKYSSLGPLLVGGAGTAATLKAFAEESAAMSGQKLGTDFAEKLANIEKVRGELGGKFSIWKQPTILSITHQRMKSGPGEQRLIRDKAKQITEDEKTSKELYAAVALGVGLLAAIPTGGSSLIAGVALAATVTGAAMSAYAAFEHAQEYLLQKATANTSLDRAYQISAEDPSLLYLAIDIASAIADVAGAKVAFTALKGTIAAAKAAKSMDKIPEVVGAMRQARISGVNQGRVLAEVLPAGGDIGKALYDIRQVFIRTAKTAADKETALLMQKVAEKALDKGKVIIIPNNKMEALDVLRKRLANRPGIDVDAKANEILKDFFAQGSQAAGFYDPATKLVYLRGNTTAEGAASVLVHELAHMGQDAKKMLDRMAIYNSEFEAFKAQQQFLNMLPYDRVPEDWAWLLKATDTDIENHVLTAYVKEGTFKPWGVDNSEFADGVYSNLFEAGAAIK